METGDILKVLFVDKDKNIFQRLYAGASLFEYDIQYAATQNQMLERIEQDCPHVLILDYELIPADALLGIRQRYGELPVILLAQYPDNVPLPELKGINVYSLIPKAQPAENLVYTLKTEIEKIHLLRRHTRQAREAELKEKYKFGSVKIMVVDDEKANCDLIEAFLEPRGFETVSCWNSEEAMPAFLKERPDIVILDLVMPHVDGMEILSRIKELKTRTRVFIVTGVNDPVVIKDAVRAGADDFIMKPFSINQIYATLIKHLSQMYEGFKP